VASGNGLTCTKRNSWWLGLCGLKFGDNRSLYIGLLVPRRAQQGYNLDSISNLVFNSCFGKIGSKGEALFVLIWFGRSRGVRLNHPKTRSAWTPGIARYTHEVKAGSVWQRWCEQATRWCGGRAMQKWSITGVKSS
jgi:hypothetical protein